MGETEYPKLKPHDDAGITVVLTSCISCLHLAGLVQYSCMLHFRNIEFFGKSEMADYSARHERFIRKI